MTKESNEWKKENIHKEELKEKVDLPIEEYREEYSTEFLPTLPNLLIDTEVEKVEGDIDWWNFGVAFTGLVVSALGVYIMPIYLGILGTSLGYLAYMKGERTITPWTISLGIAAILIGIVIAPFT